MSRVKKGQTKKIGKNDLVTLSLLTVGVAVLVLALGLHKAHAVSSRSDTGLDSAVKVLSGSDNGSDDGARAVAIQSDSKIVAAGFSSNHNSDFASSAITLMVVLMIPFRGMVGLRPTLVAMMMRPSESLYRRMVK